MTASSDWSESSDIQSETKRKYIRINQNDFNNAPALGKIIAKLLSRLLGKYLCMKTFFKILFVWQENDLGFSSDFENSITQKKKTISNLHTHNTN